MTPPLTFATGGCETALICLGGSATVATEGQTFSLGKYDSLYIPRSADVTVTPGPSGCDLAEIAAPVTRTHPVQFVAFADVQRDPGLHFTTAGRRRNATSTC